MKKKILLVLSLLIVMMISLIGCGNRNTLDYKIVNSKDISKMVNDKVHTKITEYDIYADPNASDEELEKIARNIVRKSKKDENRAVLIRVYDYKEEALRGGISPKSYIVWGPSDNLGIVYQDGVRDLMQNKYYIKHSEKGTLEIKEENIKAYEIMLKEISKDKDKSRGIKSIALNYIINPELIEKIGATDSAKANELLEPMLNRYQDNDIEKNIKSKTDLLAK